MKAYVLTKYKLQADVNNSDKYHGVAELRRTSNCIVKNL